MSRLLEVQIVTFRTAWVEIPDKCPCGNDLTASGGISARALVEMICTVKEDEGGNLNVTTDVEYEGEPGGEAPAAVVTTYRCDVCNRGFPPKLEITR